MTTELRGIRVNDRCRQAICRKTNRLINDNIDNPALTIDLTDQKLAVGRSQLHRIIKEQTALSTYLYIRKYRLLKAKELLQTTNLRISEIGDRVGISNPQNFSAYFIAEFKGSPSEFRKMNAPILSPVAETLPLPQIPCYYGQTHLPKSKP